mmetsp:Transcript_65251/g.136014  ORF Transcript_65251/g.136014 Transcript_65251/m.136014 type:complete len:300 (+) Transcript_65251:443-1342(+)
MACFDRRRGRQQPGGVEPGVRQGSVRLARRQRRVPHRQVCAPRRVHHHHRRQEQPPRLGLRPCQPQGTALRLQPRQAATHYQLRLRRRQGRVLLRRYCQRRHPQGEHEDEAVQAPGAANAHVAGRHLHRHDAGGRPHRWRRRRYHRRHAPRTAQGAELDEAGGGGHHVHRAALLGAAVLRGDVAVLDVRGEVRLAGGRAALDVPLHQDPRRRLPRRLLRALRHLLPPGHPRVERADVRGAAAGADSEPGLRLHLLLARRAGHPERLERRQDPRLRPPERQAALRHQRRPCGGGDGDRVR